MKGNLRTHSNGDGWEKRWRRNKSQSHHGNGRSAKEESQKSNADVVRPEIKIADASESNLEKVALNGAASNTTATKPDATKIDPATEAQRFLDACKIDDANVFQFWNGQFFEFRGGYFQETSVADMRAVLTRFLNQHYRNVKPGSVSSILNQLRAIAWLSDEIEPPTWLGKIPMDWKASEIFAARNILIHLPTLVSGDGNPIIKSTPRLFSIAGVDYDFHPVAARAEKWLEFLRKLWPRDPKMIEALQLWFGYVICADTSQQKILLLVGPPRSGKGTILRVLQLLIGLGNVGSPTLASLGQDFGLLELYGKSLGVISDARLRSGVRHDRIVENLLAISGEDRVSINRKHRKPISCTLPTRLMIATNELPRLADPSGAVASRLIVLRTARNFLGKEDRKLTEKLSQELPGILLWAIKGWQKLRERGQLIQPASSRLLVREMEDLASPVRAFVHQRCMVGASSTVPRHALYEAYCDWAKQQGQKPLDDATFGRNLHAAVEGLDTSQLRIDGKKLRHYVGVGLS